MAFKGSRARMRGDRWTVSVVLDQRQIDALDRMSETQDISRTALVRRAIDRFLAETNAPLDDEQREAA